jgi:hypothetical protein
LEEISLNTVGIKKPVPDDEDGEQENAIEWTF